jgi:hypothetical protein
MKATEKRYKIKQLRKIVISERYYLTTECYVTYILIYTVLCIVFATKIFAYFIKYGCLAIR